jgi:hypothetical protein
MESPNFMQFYPKIKPSFNWLNKLNPPFSSQNMAIPPFFFCGGTVLSGSVKPQMGIVVPQMGEASVKTMDSLKKWGFPVGIPTMWGPQDN